jgi:hypothetical protein
MPYKDIKKQRECQRKWESERRKREGNTQVKRKKEYLNELKSVPCSVCGNQYHPVLMDLHHLDESQKKFSPSNGVHKYGWDALREEVKKCIVVCSNCHRLIHNDLVSLIQK